ncbi:D-aminoacyl-tRNA deacylase [Candidatus Viridilinea mediisalina]|uniref:D-aminoacyl-tRNA deacylase n=1 Tax=Candidatus Viridilinea mediisalina TaxID=2024553 RepID=A0A2A6REU6_9CHLR|nr:D-aminoacyl-tRNA deacylase [Candidatus Viridilinea mediisalina]PDW01373.1 D-tyrosyl-tRNA(Tyr) deacylase [Candidatus Viridilinea mediisalina]
MRALIQRVSSASVEVANELVGQTGPGLLILLGVGQGDTEADAEVLAKKTAHLRIFGDEAGRFNHSLCDVGGSALVVSQFTLYADTRRGRRPNFSAAAPPELAAPLVEVYAQALRNYGVHVELGVFGAMMRVALVNEGPVTLMLDSATL